MSLSIKHEYQQEQAMLILQLEGMLNTDTVGILDQHLDDKILPSVKFVMLDMKNLDYISSAGIRTVFKLSKLMASRGGEVAVSNRQPQISKVFDIIQALPDMQFFVNDEEMDQYLNQVQSQIRNNNESLPT